MKHFLFVLLLFPAVCFSQVNIRGRVVDAADGKPIPDASVFLNNATIGTKSGDDGRFALNRLSAGQYDLIVRVIGYETYRQTIMVNGDVNLPDIKLLQKTMVMNEVVIAGKDRKRARKIRMFKEQFLGRSAFARQCTILNPEELILVFGKHEDVLTVHTNNFLEIDNDALGYKLKYLVNNFVLDRLTLNVSYEGDVLFEEKQGTAEQKGKWEKNRRRTYFGSPTHFLRQVLADKADANYMVRSFCIKKIDNGKVLYDTLAPVKYVHKTDRRGVFALSYPSGIDIFYYGPGVAHSLHYANGTEKGNRGQVAGIQFIDEYLYFDTRGTILNPTGALFNYQWGKSRVAELLPSDYWPVD
ncbi:carboxypeptidase-like regulatory domain-containing protein [Mucilaginibacter sp. 14171R-50]|uniref:carboxypeptidase-like regulatory domain-containing protein n=1 Tax=Mucilaginibacter sp. 14171R-50 TaxID=2703789 RepID=UPI00138BC319|nr:carboxypeptidase-like regulatory domain-containing protein [Mucilaginibacter sp. 14171R-50]QHS55666.1 carboxypeptidase-like regulatory domain-containing protein [Mucilaginibacter sp. 14171R-50]